MVSGSLDSLVHVVHTDTHTHTTCTRLGTTLNFSLSLFT